MKDKYSFKVTFIRGNDEFWEHFKNDKECYEELTSVLQNGLADQGFSLGIDLKIKAKEKA